VLSFWLAMRLERLSVFGSGTRGATFNPTSSILEFIMKIIASLGIVGFLFALVMFAAVVACWFTGVVFGFHHSIILGIVSIIPPVGFLEGLAHLIGII